MDICQLVRYLDTNSVANPNHHGSREGQSTATALIQLYNARVKEVDKGNMVGVMMVDLSVAFDMVDYDLLLQKLELFGLDTPATACSSGSIYTRKLPKSVGSLGCFGCFGNFGSYLTLNGTF